MRTCAKHQHGARHTVVPLPRLSGLPGTPPPALSSSPGRRITAACPGGSRSKEGDPQMLMAQGGRWAWGEVRSWRWEGVVNRANSMSSGKWLLGGEAGGVS